MKNDLTEYDNLECPMCDKLCKPHKILRDKTVQYSKHSCLACYGDETYFSIDEDGNLVL